MGQSLTFRTQPDVLEQLQKQAKQVHLPKTVLAERYVQEGLAMDQFPGIVFRGGALGRRPGLSGGPDVWEVVEIFRAESLDLAATAQNLGLQVGLVEAALRYYGSHQAEVDLAIETNRQLLEQARLEYEQGEQVLQR
ncbi:MAG: hypothetical protein ACYCYK_12990 [Candidatus Dormibacteria bacterium]